MEDLIAKYRAKVMERIDQKAPLSNDDVLAINDAIRVLSRFSTEKKAAVDMAARKINF